MRVSAHPLAQWNNASPASSGVTGLNNSEKTPNHGAEAISSLLTPLASSQRWLQPTTANKYRECALRLLSPIINRPSAIAEFNRRPFKHDKGPSFLGPGLRGIARMSASRLALCWPISICVNSG
jgi:hypothetical protein